MHLTEKCIVADLSGDGPLDFGFDLSTVAEPSARARHKRDRGRQIRQRVRNTV
jgi:hypothetical protein